MVKKINGVTGVGTKPHKGGFTLIEILVVVAIISILASVVLVGLGPTQRIGRDARRISDLRQVQNGLELYFNKCGYYPGTVQAGATCVAYVGIAVNDWAALTSSLKDSVIGIVNVPDDPTGGVHYFYGAAAGGTGYVLGATLENVSNPVLNQSVHGMVNGVNCASPVYCIQF